MRTQAAPAIRGRWPRAEPHVVVGVDGCSAGGRHALAWAADEVTATGGRLTVCRVGPPPPGGPGTAVLELFDPPFARAVRAVRQRLGGERVDLRLVPGDPATQLCAAAGAADLLVVGAPAASDVSSVAARVAVGCTRPVVVVRPGPGAGGMFAGQVAVAVAGSGVDTPALAFGFGYATVHHFPLVAVHVTAAAAGDYWFDERTLETHFATEPHALRVLSAAVEPFLVRYPDVATRLVVLTGDPLCRLVDDVGAGARLTVVGRRHRRMAHRALGRVNGALVMNGAGPLVVVPPE
ncbi:universal stress protein [Virgisporangium aliadipatigenens]|uniref:Universal stress protein n=2 Tax=Virgisporangium aliadipatigenens TaxID=741659 RepID=A0A8J4DRF9_9ACTN|nr:universal stress protein [Virgisporangium aliadipatigenens]